MSEQEKEELVLRVKAANAPILKAIWGGAITMAAAVATGIWWLAITFSTVQSNKKAVDRMEPVVAQHVTDIAVIKSKLHIK
ncbi:MAG: hypothetical protein KF744_08965 [Taibaiella sp.]|nr:hypothetical protein [Taibaiella sp.]